MHCAIVSLLDCRPPHVLSPGVPCAGVPCPIGMAQIGNVDNNANAAFMMIAESVNIEKSMSEIAMPMLKLARVL